MPTILIPTKLDTAAADILRDNGFDVVQDADKPLDELVRAHADAIGLIVRSEKITAAVIDALSNLKVIVRAGSGYDNVDTKHARRQGIDVMNTPGANANAVAEEVIALVLAAYRHVIPADASTRTGAWEKKKFMGRELSKKTVGIVGLGNIGQLVAQRLAGFDNRILVYDPVVSADKAEELGAELCSLQELFAAADIITLHLPETDETQGMINRDLLSVTKSGVILINCARAGIVNEDDVRAIKADKDLIFCTDVYAADAPGEKSVADIADIMLPHLGANTSEANRNAACRAAEQLVAYVQRGVCTHVVNRAVPEGLDEGHVELAFYLAKVARHYLGTETPPSRVEASFYGGLDEYSNWLLAPIVSGLSAHFDSLFDYQDAAEYLEEKGIAYVKRDGDDSKKYGRSMTIDLFEGSGTTFSKVSVRGTLTESNPMVSRIDGFDKLYFDPQGHSVLVAYEDRPGVLAKITGVMAKHAINIDDMRAPHDTKTGESMAVLKVNRPVSQVMLDEITEATSARRAVHIEIR